LAVAGTPAASDSRTIRTICSSLNLDFFMVPRYPRGPSSQVLAGPKIAGQVTPTQDKKYQTHCPNI
jgi:hypothetical protein